VGFRIGLTAGFALNRELHGTLASIDGTVNSRSQGAAKLPGHECIRNADMSTSAVGWGYEASCAASALIYAQNGTHNKVVVPKNVRRNCQFRLPVNHLSAAGRGECCKARPALGILIRVPNSCMSKVQLRRRIQFSSLLVKSFVIIRHHAVALDIYGRHG
jgi:hypothetical protein